MSTKSEFVLSVEGLTVSFDGFKAINDTFGHQVGDDVLRYFAALMQKNVKGKDIVARYGGEEFAVLLI